MSTRKSGLFYKIESAIAFAEEVAAAARERQASRRIGDEVLGGLLEARTYVEVGQLRASEVKQALARASRAAHELTDDDPAYAPLLSRLRLLQEEAANAARARTSTA